MTDVPDFGLRPIIAEGQEAERDAREAIAVCPGIGLTRKLDELPAGVIEELVSGWGPVLEVWEGYASYSALRFAGSSGGAASALAIAAMERGGMHGTLHIAARPSAPYLNETVLSTTREELLQATGSRYAPASPCDGLGRIESAPSPCVFVGKPCDVAAAEKARALRPELDRMLGLTIAIFCAGTPSTNGTLELLRRMGVKDLSTVKEVRYRGNGWPGMATVTIEDESGRRSCQETYSESWELLQSRRQWRCYVCADHTGEFADIAVGDPWYREIPDDEPGRSLILVRSPRGKRLFEAAVKHGYLTAERAAPEIVYASQPELLQTRGALLGRIATTRLLGAAAPKFRGFPMWPFFRSELGLKEKAQSFYGTAKRVFSKRLLRRIPVRPKPPHPGEPREAESEQESGGRLGNEGDGGGRDRPGDFP
jgi:coenzyme F420 hydrogenase subunit beta